MAELQPIIVFHGRHFVPHLGICNTLIRYVRCHFEQFKKKTTSLSQTVFLRSTKAAYTQTHRHTHTQTHTHTHTHTTIAQGEMQRVAFRLKTGRSATRV